MAINYLVPNFIKICWEIKKFKICPTKSPPLYRGIGTISEFLKSDFRFGFRMSKNYPAPNFIEICWKTKFLQISPPTPPGRRATCRILPSDLVLGCQTTIQYQISWKSVEKQKSWKFAPPHPPLHRGKGPFPEFLKSDLRFGFKMSKKLSSTKFHWNLLRNKIIANSLPPPWRGEGAPLQNFENLTSDLVLGGQKTI